MTEEESRLKKARIAADILSSAFQGGVTLGDLRGPGETPHKEQAETIARAFETIYNSVERSTSGTATGGSSE